MTKVFRYVTFLDRNHNYSQNFYIMDTTKNSNSSVKLVWCAGIQIPADKVEGRLKALAQGRALKTLLADDQAKEDKRLADEGYKPEEIACLRHVNRIRQMEAQGFGTSSRCRLGSPQRVRTYSKKSALVVENPQLVEEADKLLAASYN